MAEYLGTKVATPKLGAYFLGSIVYHTVRGWLGMGPRYLLHIVRTNGKMLEELAVLVQTGQLRVVIDREFAGLDSARDLHVFLETNSAKGKVVLKV
jgi:NADPH:quinone reductase-like Zn-dependent oxidoreductase